MRRRSLLLSTPIVDLRLNSIAERIRIGDFRLALQAAGFLADELREACQPVPIQSRAGDGNHTTHRAKFLAIEEQVLASMQHLEVGAVNSALECIKCARQQCAESAPKRIGATGNVSR
jgi:hypothetical protein